MNLINLKFLLEMSNLIEIKFFILKFKKKLNITIEIKIQDDLLNTF